MEINEALYSYLSTYAGLSALISTRIYPDILPQDPTYPAITYSDVSEDEVETFNTPNTLIGPTIQFTCWGETRASTKAVAKQLRLAFKNYSGVMAGESGLTVSAIKKINSISDIETENNRIIAYKVMMDFEIWYQE